MKKLTGWLLVVLVVLVTECTARAADHKGVLPIAGGFYSTAVVVENPSAAEVTINLETGAGTGAGILHVAPGAVAILKRAEQLQPAGVWLRLAEIDSDALVSARMTFSDGAHTATFPVPLLEQALDGFDQTASLSPMLSDGEDFSFVAIFNVGEYPALVEISTPNLSERISCPGGGQLSFYRVPDEFGAGTIHVRQVHAPVGPDPFPATKLYGFGVWGPESGGSQWVVPFRVTG